MPDQQRFIEHSCTAGLTNDLVQKFSNVFSGVQWLPDFVSMTSLGSINKPQLT